MIIIDLIHNLALLLALIVISGFVQNKFKQKIRLHQILQGVLFGATAIIGMLDPFVLREGIIFDGRSIILSLCALFFGPVTGSIAAIIALIFRISLGGTGIIMGSLVIVTSFLIGYIFHIRRSNNPNERLSVLRLYVFGLYVHAAMMLLVLTLPSGNILQVYESISLTVMGIYPLVTILMGKILLDQEENINYVKKLSENEERLRLSLSAANQGLFDLNVKTGKAIVNDEYATMLDYDPKTFKESMISWIRRVHLDDREIAIKAYKDYIDGKINEHRVEVRHKTADGGWKWILSTGKIVERDENGNPLRMLGTHTDISRLKEIVSALQKSEEKFAKMFRSSPDTITLTALKDGFVVDVNETAINVTGFTRDELIGKKTTLLNIWARSKDREKYISELMETGRVNNFETQFIMKSGEIKDALISGEVIELDGEKYVLGVIRDITERKLREKALRENQVKLQSVISNSPVIIFGLDENGIFTFSEGKGLEILGLKPGEVVGQSALDVYEGYPKVVDTLERALKGEVISEIHDMGQWVFDVYYSPLRDDRGKIKGLIGVATDITERKKAQDSLFKSEAENRAIVDAVPDILFRLSRSGVYLGYKNSTNSLPYVSPEIFMGKNISDVLPTEVSAQLFDAIESSFSSGKIVSIEYKLNLDDNEMFYETKIVPLANDEVYCFVRDITDRKNTEEALRQSLEENQAITDAIPDLLFRLNREGVFVDYKNTNEELLFVPPREFLGKNIEDVLPAALVSKFRKGINDAFSSNSIINIEYPLTIKQKELFFEGKLVPLTNDEILCFVRDITDRKKIENNLRESEEKFRTIFDAAPVPLAVNDNNQNIILLNEEFVKIFGYTNEDIPTLKEWWPLAYPDVENQKWVKTTWQKNIEESRKTGKPFEPLELNIRAKNGDIKTVIAGMSWLGNTSDRNHLVILYDITDRKRAEQEIKKNNEELAQLFELSLNLLESVNPSDTYRKILKHAIQLIGIDTGAIYSVDNDKIFLENTIPSLGEDFPNEFRKDLLDNHPHIQKAINTESPIIVNDIEETELSENEKIILNSRKMYSLLYLPIITEKKATGVIILGTIERKHEFTQHEIELGRTISNISSLSMENSILFSKLNKNVRDLRKAVEEKNIVTDALKESEERFHTMFENHHAVMMLIEPDSGKIIDANKSAENFYGYSLHELRNLNIANINQLTESELKKALDKAAHESKTYFNFPHKLKSGEVKSVEVFTTPITVKDITLLFSIVHDITERKIAEEEVLRSQEQLRALAARLEKIREDERINLSRELHDNLGQSLTGLKMDVAWLARKIGSKKKEKTENFLTKTTSMSELIDQIINDVRRISTDLRPNLLDYLGLHAALEWLVNDFSKRTEIECVFNSMVKNMKLDISISNSIYRIIQEAFTNIARHSGATKVELEIVQNNNQINFVIKDNGKGITKAEINNVKSLGLRGMQERTFQLNGELSIIGKKDKGTTVTLSIPKEN